MTVDQLIEAYQGLAALLTKTLLELEEREQLQSQIADKITGRTYGAVRKEMPELAKYFPDNGPAPQATALVVPGPSLVQALQQAGLKLP